MNILIKYVMFNECFPVIFCAPVSHRAVAASLQTDNHRVTSAGFIHNEKGEIVTYGESETLKGLGPSASDARVIMKFLGMG